jgi:uridine kinase
MKPITIGVAGGSASGKTTVSKAIEARVGAEFVAHLQHDNYYKDLSHLPLEERTKLNFDHPGSLETDLLVAHLRELIGGHTVEIPVYDFTTYSRTIRTQHVEPRPVILVEGILIFTNRALRELLDIKVYVDADADLRLARRILRDVKERGRTVESIIQQYLETVKPMHLEFVEPSKSSADIIIPATGSTNLVAIDIVATRIETAISRLRPQSDPKDTGGKESVALYHSTASGKNTPSL